MCPFCISTALGLAAGTATTDERVAPVEYNYQDKRTLEVLGQTYHIEGEQPGASVFLRDGDRVFLTYETRGRGVEALGSVWTFLDLTPLGRQEDWEDTPPGRPQGPRYQWWDYHDAYGAEVAA